MNGTSSATNLVAVGSAQQGWEQVSVQVLQHIYHHITKRSETLERTFAYSILFQLEHLHDLYGRLKQALEQYQVRAENDCIVVNYANGRRLEFSSYDRFKLQAGSLLEHIESIVLKVNFLIVLPKLNEAQSYTLTIEVTSRMARVRRLRREIFNTGSPPAALLRLAAGPTIEASLKFVDYLVAKALTSIVDEWATHIEQRERPTWIRFAQRHSRWIPRASKMVLGGLALWVVYQGVERFLIGDNANLADLARFQILALAFVSVMYSLSRALGETAQRSIDAYLDISCINITPGDKKALAEADRANSRHALKFILVNAVNLVLGVIASIIATCIV